MTPSAWALLTMAVEDSYAVSGGAVPDPRILAHWDVLGHLTAQDTLLLGTLTLSADRVFYGYLLRSLTDPTEYAVVIRGTHGFAEWVIDGMFAPRQAHPVAGEVESGFYGLAQTLLLDGEPLMSVLPGVVGMGTVTVVGHSLGAALAQFVAFDLASWRYTTLKLIASPHAGNAVFEAALAALVTSDSIAWASTFDLVTHVPELFGYAAFPNTVILPRNPVGYKINWAPAAQHHCLTYALRLDPTLDLAALPACDAAYVAVIWKA